MSKIVLYMVAFGIALHALIHLMGFVAYLQLADIEELPYKTILLNGRWSVGEYGIRAFGVLWLLVSIGFVIGISGLVTQQSWWLPVLFIITIISLILTILDWEVAFRGVFVNIVILVVLTIALGLRTLPAPFTVYPEQTRSLPTTRLPDNLPSPVLRFYETIVGDDIPVIETAVLTGQASLRLNGVTFPSRLRFTHNAGQGYRHYIEVTIFGFPLLTVEETYLDDKARLALPFGVIENEPKIDMSANLALWGEAVWFPSIYLTDPRVQWEMIDNSTARLTIPFRDSEDTFTLTFDPESGLLTKMKAFRWRDKSDKEKIGWVIEPLNWTIFNDIMIPSVASVAWEDEETPWLVMTIQEVTYNADVSRYISASGL